MTRSQGRGVSQQSACCCEVWVPLMVSQFKNKTAQPTFLTHVASRSEISIYSFQWWNFLSFFILGSFYPTWGNIPLDFCLVFFFFLIGHHPQPPGTMKNHWSFLKQEVTRSIWGFIRQVSWNLWYGPAHVSNLGLGASSQPCSVLIPLDVSAESRGIFRSSLCRVTPAGWVVPVENSSLGIGLWSYNLSVVPGPFF